MDRLARPTIGVLSAVGLVLSLVVHTAALWGVDVSAHVPGVWLLHIGVFLVFVPMLIYARIDRGSMPSGPELLGSLPTWAMYLGIALTFYTVVNFFLFFAGTEGGNPEIRNGQYVLASHGKFVRNITADEYVAFRANVVRGFSGHWMFFYSVPAAFFLLGKNSERPGVEA